MGRRTRRSTAQRVDAEYRVRHRDGGWRQVRDSAVIVRDDAGQAVRVVSVTSDVTTEHERQEAMARAASEALAVADTAERARAEAEAVKEEMMAATRRHTGSCTRHGAAADKAGGFKNELLAVVSHELRGPWPRRARWRRCSRAPTAAA